MMACSLFPLMLFFLLTEVSVCLPLSGAEAMSRCPAQWLLFGDKCFMFYPVWSSWSAAASVCTQTGGNLASLHTPEERQFVLQLVNTHTSVWLGGYKEQKNSSWLWSDGSPFRIRGWTNKRPGTTKEGGACMHMDPKSGELNSAPCGELKFYICSTRASFRLKFIPRDRKPAEPAVVSGLSVFDVMWGYSDTLVEEILRSSSFIEQLRSGQLTQSCYTSFIQQEALYLHRVSSTLEVVIRSLQEADDVRSLLLDTLKHYSSTNQTLLSSPFPPWLLWSLQSFSSVVFEDPIYFLVALSARSSLQSSLTKELEVWDVTQQAPGTEAKTSSFYQEWREKSVTEATWTQRYRKAIEKHQDKVDAFEAVNIFRVHMMNQKSFYKSLDCYAEDER